MIARKLAAFFTMIAFIIFASTWLVRRLAGMNAVSVITLFTHSCVIILAYFIIGLFLAQLGVALVRELMEGIHREEAERRERARDLYLAAISGGKPAGLGEAEFDVEGVTPAEPDAPPPGGAAPKG